MGSKTTKTKEQSTATTQPQVPSFAMPAIENYFGGVTDYMNAEPGAWLPPQNAIQQGAYSQAQGLLDNSTLLNTAGGIARDVASLAGNKPWMNPAYATNPAAPAVASLSQIAANAPDPLPSARYDPTLATNPNAPDLASLNATQARAPGVPGLASFNAAQATGPNAPQLGSLNATFAANPTAPALATLADPSRYNVTGQQIAGAAAPTAARADVAQLAGPRMANAPVLGDPSRYAFNAAQIADTGPAQYGRASDFMDAYNDPYIEDVVNAALADFDHESAVQQAELDRLGAVNKAFGDSNFAIQKAELGGNLARGRAATDAGLRSDAFRFAGQMGAGDAANATSAGLTNAQLAAARAGQQAGLNQESARFASELGSQYDLARYGTEADLGKFNAGAANDFSLADFGERGLTNRQYAQNANDMATENARLEADRRARNAGFAQDANLANADRASQYDLTRFGAENARQAMQYGADVDTGRFNAGAANDAAGRYFDADAAMRGQVYGTQAEMARYNAGLSQDALSQNTAAANALRAMQYGTEADLSKFNAGLSQDVASRVFDAENARRSQIYDAGVGTARTNAGFANDAASQYAAAENARRNQIYGTQAAVNQFNAGLDADRTGRVFDAQNRQNEMVYGAGVDTNRFNAGATNDFTLANDQARQQALMQQLAAAGLLGDLSGQGINNLGGLLDIGNAQWAQDNLYSPLSQLQIGGSLLNPDGTLNTITGQRVDSSGTTTQKTSGGLLGQILQVAGQLGSAALMAAPAASERRVKRDIVLLDREPDGLGVYRYNYRWDAPDEPPRYGVMADEVEALRPWALGPRVDGVQTVAYGAL